MTTTTRQLPPPVKEETRAKYVGKVGLLDFGGLLVNVAIDDIRYRYGNIDVLVHPVSGAGTRWVQADKLLKVN